MERHTAGDPERHPLIPGGQRKARWARPGGGKSGGIRVIYYFAVPDAVYLIDVYAKNEKENLSDAEKGSPCKNPPSDQAARALGSAGYWLNRPKRSHAT